MDNGTIDITNLVSSMTSDFVSIETDLAMTEIALIPSVGPFLVGPVIGVITKFVVEKIISKLANGVRQQAFFFNTAVRKASQAGDYADASNALASLPESTSDADYKAAEEKRAQAFNDFVVLTN